MGSDDDDGGGGDGGNGGVAVRPSVSLVFFDSFFTVVFLEETDRTEAVFVLHTVQVGEETGLASQSRPVQAARAETKQGSN